MSDKIIKNLQSQLQLYKQLFEKLENSEASPTPTYTPTHTPTHTPTRTPTNDIPKPKSTYIKTEELLKLFNITKNEYNNILVRINNRLNPLF